jgi:hypothetical protein
MELTIVDLARSIGIQLAEELEKLGALHAHKPRQSGAGISDVGTHLDRVLTIN